MLPVLVHPSCLLPGALAASARLLSGPLASLSLCQSRGCAHSIIHTQGTETLPAGAQPHQRSRAAGNVYPALSADQLAAMRQRRLSCNVGPAHLAEQQAHRTQAKSIILVSSATASRPSCQGCAGCDAAAERSWAYLQRRLGDINQLRGEDSGDEEPIHCSRIDCSEARSLLPPLAAAQACHGPVAVVFPEGVWYERISPLVLERIIEEHLLGGHIVTSHQLLGSRASSPACTKVLPAIDITRRATPNGSWAAHYAR